MSGPSVFTEAELAYLHEMGRLGRIATVGSDGTPHVVPSGWAHNRELDTIDVTGHAVEETKKFRDVLRSGRAAIVIDDVASVNPWRPRAIEVRGRAEAVREPEALIRIHPERIVSWGVEDRRSARTVGRQERPDATDAAGAADGGRPGAVERGVYQIARLALESDDAFTEYGRAVLPLVSAAGGRILSVSRGGADRAVIEGGTTEDVIVLSWWPSRAAFEGFYASAGYAPWRERRHRFADTELLLLGAFGSRARP